MAIKQIISTLLTLVVLCGFTLVPEDKETKVLIPTINKKYKGNVKKGLAHGEGEAWGETDHYKGMFKKGYPHGKGIYTWGNGNKYNGEFVKGKMSGQGELRIKQETKPDSVLTGYFKNNDYIGKYKEPYRTFSEQGIRKVDFQKNAGEINQVAIMVYAGGQQIAAQQISVRDPKNTIKENRGGNLTLTNVVFPLEQVNVSFSVGQFSYNLTFEIFEEGNWTVIISV